MYASQTIGQENNREFKGDGDNFKLMNKLTQIGMIHSSYMGMFSCIFFWSSRFFSGVLDLTESKNAIQNMFVNNNKFFRVATSKLIYIS